MLSVLPLVPLQLGDRMERCAVRQLHDRRHRQGHRAARGAGVCGELGRQAQLGLRAGTLPRPEGDTIVLAFAPVGPKGGLGPLRLTADRILTCFEDRIGCAWCSFVEFGTVNMGYKAARMYAIPVV